MNRDTHDLTMIDHAWVLVFLLLLIAGLSGHYFVP